MKLRSLVRLVFVTLAFALFIATSAYCQTFTYLGSYSADGKYQPMVPATHWYEPVSAPAANPAVKPTARPAEVPPSINMHPLEYTIENYQPPVRGKKVLKGQSRLASMRDSIVTFAYGRELALVAPHDVISDSTGRVILTDAATGAVHVLDGDNSFRIVAGKNRRLQTPSGLAVDAADNIYVADSEQGVVVVYDRSGNFLRYIGKFGENETLFHYPTGIAIDRRTSRLYVLDTERHALFITDLEGKLIRRVGRYNTNDTVVDFNSPTAIAVGESELAIMDAAGSRLWITGLDGNPRTNFRFPTPLRQGIVDELGLAIDASDNIYISNGTGSNVQIYDRKGMPLGVFGRVGPDPGEFERPTGLWIDASNRIFVADESTRRVQVFQLSTPQKVLMAAGE